MNSNAGHKREYAQICIDCLRDLYKRVNNLENKDVPKEKK